MIKNWNRKELNMSFEGISPHPSDIDMFVLKDNTLIIGEIKNDIYDLGGLEMNINICLKKDKKTIKKNERYDKTDKT